MAQMRILRDINVRQGINLQYGKRSVKEVFTRLSKGLEFRQQILARTSRRGRNAIGLKILSLPPRRWRKIKKNDIKVLTLHSMVGSSVSMNVLMVVAKKMFCEELFHDPNLRKFLRDLFLKSNSGPSRASYSVKPT